MNEEQKFLLKETVNTDGYKVLIKVIIELADGFGEQLIKINLNDTDGDELYRLKAEQSGAKKLATAIQRELDKIRKLES